MHLQKCNIKNALIKWMPLWNGINALKINEIKIKGCTYNKNKCFD